MNNNHKQLPYLDANLPIEERIADLVSRMSLEEKVRQLDIYSGNEISTEKGDIKLNKVEEISGGVGIGCLQNRNSDPKTNNKIQRYNIENTRLGIPILFSEEALHGLIWPGCTVFPQQIALASTFEPGMAKRQGRAIATECRSLGICETWSPVLDLAHDPRWGRVEEGYGEDTYLSARFAEAMVNGLQSDDMTKNDTIIAEPKHFSGYGAPTGGLNCAPAMMGRHEHAFYCLPVFEAAFKAGALNTMCSYNSIDGIPVACDRSLLTDVLRGQFGMQGFVRADMTAVAMLHTCHFVADSPREAIRMGLEAGVDMQLYDFSHDVYQNNIIDLVQKGDIDESIVDTAVSRVLRVKFMLGLFENPYTDETLHKDVVHCDEHINTSLDVARKAICLLKNKDNTLPLKKDIKSIAVIGPSAAVPRFGDYSTPGVCESAVTLLDGIKNIVSEDTEVVYAKGCNILESELMPIPESWLKDSNDNKGLKGEYFNSETFEELPVHVRNDQQINFNWIYSKPAEGINADRFAVRWTGKIVPDRSFDGYIGISSMDSMRLWIDGELVVDRWEDNDDCQMIDFKFVKGNEYDVKIEFMNDQRGVRVIFGYSYGEMDMDAAVEAAKKAEVAVIAVGDSEETCGENLDRADLNLPGRQAELVKRVNATGTPVVLVLQNGRPLSITWEAENIPAIVEAWHIGEQGGRAIVEVLFGDINPAGRLPMSFPKSVGQIPVNYNRRPFGATKYVEMDWLPLFPFGFGLSYTTFEYKNLSMSSYKIKQSETVEVSFDVTNTGRCAGDEVAQVYIHDTYSSIVRPYKELAGFKRVHLDAGETKTIKIELGFEQLRLLNRNYEWIVEPGKFEVMVGPDSVNLPLKGEFTVEK